MTIHAPSDLDEGDLAAIGRPRRPCVVRAPLPRGVDEGLLLALEVGDVHLMAGGRDEGDLSPLGGPGCSHGSDDGLRLTAVRVGGFGDDQRDDSGRLHVHVEDGPCLSPHLDGRGGEGRRDNDGRRRWWRGRRRRLLLPVARRQHSQHQAAGDREAKNREEGSPHYQPASWTISGSTGPSWRTSRYLRVSGSP